MKSFYQFEKEQKLKFKKKYKKNWQNKWNAYTRPQDHYLTK